MENTNKSVTPAVPVILPEPLPNESDFDYGFRCVQEVGALAFFTRARDYSVQLANDLKKIAATRPLTDVEKQNARELSNQIIEQQSFCDAAFKFEQITETSNLAVN